MSDDDMLSDSQSEALAQLAAIRAVVADTTTLSSILDDSWFNDVEAEIRTIKGPGILSNDKAGLVAALSHLLRGTSWFEKDQQLLLNGKASEIDIDGQLALAMFGTDPLLTFVPLLESRLKALRGVPFKQSVIDVKFGQLRKTRTDPTFRNHLFEASVLGDFALKGVLTDIEDGLTGVDGVVDLGGRDILVEVTCTSQDIMPEFTGFISLNAKKHIGQVVEKIRKKVADGRQIALARGVPALLFLGLRRRGADSKLASIAIQGCFRDATFAALSGLVVADGWRFLKTRWYPGQNPDGPLSAQEADRIQNWYGEAV